MKHYKILLLVIVILCIVFACILKYVNTNSAINKDNKTVQLVFTTDENYKEYLKVTLKSAIVNKNPDSIYNINILGVNLPEEEINKFKDFEKTNIKINTIPFDINSIKDIGKFQVTNHVSRADLLKFLFTDIFPQYDKILYIDSDTLILGDLLELYNTNISGKYLGIARYNREPVCYKKIFWNIYYKSNNEYKYNCGVLLMNLKKMRKDNIKEKLIISKNRDFICKLMTQDAFNAVIPLRKTKILSPIYNHYSRMIEKDFRYMKINFKDIEEYLKGIDTYEDLQKKAVIVHFAGKYKPWNNPEINFGKEWQYYFDMVKQK